MKACNLSVIKEKANVAFFETPEASSEGKEVVRVFDEISKILMDNGINEKYLKLC